MNQKLTEKIKQKIYPKISAMMPIEIFNYFWKYFQYFYHEIQDLKALYHEYEDPYTHDQNHYQPHYF